VGWFLNPLDIALPRPERYAGLVARGFGGLTERDRFSDTVDSVLYESADSYAQTRLIYLQNRRFELGEAEGGPPAEETFTDPYEELYGD
jgi:phospholipid-binding lipoprotein MlaA